MLMDDKAERERLVEGVSVDETEFDVDGKLEEVGETEPEGVRCADGVLESERVGVGLRLSVEEAVVDPLVVEVGV